MTICDAEETIDEFRSIYQKFFLLILELRKVKGCQKNNEKISEIVGCIESNYRENFRLNYSSICSIIKEVSRNSSKHEERYWKDADEKLDEKLKAIVTCVQTTKGNIDTLLKQLNGIFENARNNSENSNSQIGKGDHSKLLEYARGFNRMLKELNEQKVKSSGRCLSMRVTDMEPGEIQKIETTYFQVCGKFQQNGLFQKRRKKINRTKKKIYDELTENRIKSKFESAQKKARKNKSKRNRIRNNSK